MNNLESENVKKTDYYINYIIEKNESLYSLAKKNNINPNLLATLNGLEINDYVYDGQEIMIPKSDYSYYITKDADTVNGVADIFSTNVNNIIKDNNTIYLKEGQLIVSRIR